MDTAQITAYVERCIHDAPAPCSGRCPFGLDVRSFMKKVEKGRLSSACREYAAAVLFPTVVSSLCPHPCTGACQRARIGDEPVDIRGLEQAALELAGAPEPTVFQLPEKPERIAVIGAGPAGLAAALNMARKKYAVTVFEAGEELGGSLRELPGFPAYREDILRQFSPEKVDFRFCHPVNSLDELAEYAAIYIATGAGGNDFGLLPGWDKERYSTDRPGVFLGGALAGQPLMESIAAGAEISMHMEAVIQTGRMADIRRKVECHGHSLVPENAESRPFVPPADADGGYTKAEAKAEAGRCFQCGCDKCRAGCELLEKYRKTPHQMAMEVIADSSPHFLAGRTMTRETYACSQCGRCAGVCPEGIDLGGLLQMSRTARAADGIQPEAFHDFWLRDLEFASSEGFYFAGPQNKPCDYAFFPGCQLSATLPEQTLAAQRWLTERYGAGVVLGCCGASAWWAGEQALWEENARRLRAAWLALGRPVFVLACATCGEMLARLTPEIQTVSLYELLAQEEALPAFRPFPEAAVFDPCSARHADAMRQGVRRLAERTGCGLHSLPEPGRCCGWGGHMRTADPALYDTITEHRAAASDLPYIVYCANCREVFLERGKPCRHILEAVFGPCDETYYLHQKTQNRLTVKGKLMMQMEGKTYTPPVREEDALLLRIDDALRQEMERQLISEDDVRACVWESLRTGERFTDGEGHYLACLPKRVMTYWVEYVPADGGYTITRAYCHRMRFESGAAE